MVGGGSHFLSRLRTSSLAVVACASVEQVASIGQRLFCFLAIGRNVRTRQVRKKCLALGTGHRTNIKPFVTVRDDDDVGEGRATGCDDRIRFPLGDLNRVMVAHAMPIAHPGPKKFCWVRMANV